ncbi:MAG: hypothetical protein ABJ308_12680 [Halieaceae bacterium]
MRTLTATLLLGLLAPHWAAADVLSASREGFSLRIETLSQATPDVSYQAFTAIERWWDPAHSYAGVASNLSLDVSPGGAFLEKLSNGGFVKHLEVVYAQPGKEIRLLGGLGPLQPMGLYGALTVQFEAYGKGSKTIMLYNVGGFSSAGLENLAPIVDAVQAAQMQRHAAYADILMLER